jgi:ribosome-associated toxin RatA of RatAB toxin-antitoxin module
LNLFTCGRVQRAVGLLLALNLIVLTQSNYQSTEAKAAAKQASKTLEFEDETRDGKLFYVSKMLIKAKAEHVWQILTDYTHATRIFPILHKCEILEDHGTTKIAKHVVAPNGLPCTYEYTLRITENAPHILEWHRVKGDFKELDGFWKLEPVEAGRYTMVTYASHMTGGIMEPPFLIRRQFHIDAPMSLLALKNHAEQMQQIASGHADLTSTQ